MQRWWYPQLLLGDCQMLLDFTTSLWGRVPFHVFIHTWGTLFSPHTVPGLWVSWLVGGVWSTGLSYGRSALLGFSHSCLCPSHQRLLPNLILWCVSFSLVPIPIFTTSFFYLTSPCPAAVLYDSLVAKQLALYTTVQIFLDQALR